MSRFLACMFLALFTAEAGFCAESEDSSHSYFECDGAIVVTASGTVLDGSSERPVPNVEIRRVDFGQVVSATHPEVVHSATDGSFQWPIHLSLHATVPADSTGPISWRFSGGVRLHLSAVGYDTTSVDLSPALRKCVQSVRGPSPTLNLAPVQLRRARVVSPD